VISHGDGVRGPFYGAEILKIGVNRGNKNGTNLEKII
jgi:hypothetical protein